MRCEKSGAVDAGEQMTPETKRRLLSPDIGTSVLRQNRGSSCLPTLPTRLALNALCSSVLTAMLQTPSGGILGVFHYTLASVSLLIFSLLIIRGFGF